MFAFRVGSDWKQVFEQVLTGLRALYDSGDYYKDWYKSNSAVVEKVDVEKKLESVAPAYS